MINNFEFLKAIEKINNENDFDKKMKLYNNTFYNDKIDIFLNIRRYIRSMVFNFFEESKQGKFEDELMKCILECEKITNRNLVLVLNEWRMFEINFEYYVNDNQKNFSINEIFEMLHYIDLHEMLEMNIKKQQKKFIINKEYLYKDFPLNLSISILTHFADIYVDESLAEIKKIDNKIVNSTFFSRIILPNVINNKSRIFLIKYINTLLQFNKIYFFDDLKSNPLITAFFSGKINDYQILLELLPLISKSIFDEFIGNDINKIYKYFKAKYQNKTLKLIILEYIKKLSLRDISDFVINHKIDINNLKEQSGDDLFQWLNYKEVRCYMFEKMNSIKFGMLYGISANFLLYFAKNSNRLSDNFLGNVSQIIEDRLFYDDKDLANIKDYFNNRLLYDIEYANNISIGDLNSLCSKPYYNVNLSFEKSIALLQGHLEKKIMLYPETLKRCIRVIAKGILLLGGIRQKCAIFFMSDNEYGIYGKEKNFSNDIFIFINSNLVKKFLYSKKEREQIEIFKVMFHEIEHALVYNEIDLNIFDFKNYITLQEKIVFEKDVNFYNLNYRKIYNEYYPRKAELKKTLQFLEIINKDYALQIKNKILYDIEKRLYIYRSKLSEKKYSSISRIFVPFSHYFAKIMESTPQLIEKYPILNCEFDKNGKRKTVEEIFLSEDERIILKKENHVDIIKNLLYTETVIFDMSKIDDFILMNLQSNEMKKLKDDYFIDIILLKVYNHFKNDNYTMFKDVIEKYVKFNKMNNSDIKKFRLDDIDEKYIFKQLLLKRSTVKI